MDSIIIKKLTLENYRQYLDQEIAFEYNEKQNLFILQGQNGFGKSNIFNAINWCFFGVEEHLKSESNQKIEPICNTRILNNLGANKSATSKVTIHLDTPDGPKILERQQTFRKNSSGHILKDKSEFSINECFGVQWDIAPYPDYIVSQILPSQMKNFFFIDGEKLRVLFENISPDDIRESIFDLSQINMLQNTIEHLNSFKSQLRRQVKDSQDLSKYVGRIESSKDEIIKLKDECKKLKKQHTDATVIKHQLDSEIEAFGNKDINALESEKKRLEESILGMQELLENADSEYLEYLLSVAPTIICYDEINKSKEIIEKSQKDGLYPPPKPRRAVISHILNCKSGECFCGGKLDDEKRKMLQELLSSEHAEDAEEIIKDVHTLQTVLGQFRDEYNSFDSRVNKFESNLTSLQESISSAQKQLKEVNTQLGNTDIEKVNRLTRERSKYEALMKETDNEINMYTAQMKVVDNLIKEVEKKYNQELNKEEKYKEVRAKIQLVDKCMRSLTDIKESIMSVVRNEISNHTKEFFCNLVSSKDFDRVEIDENYQLIVERDGYNCIHSLSAAETLCLGYSFMAALRKSSGFLAPVVIDTPLAKVDSNYRKNVAQWIMNSLGVAQVILLVTDTEYTSNFRAEIHPIISQEFQISHNKDSRTSEVIENGK